MSEIVASEREQLALKTVKKYMWWSMGAGLVPLPVADLIAVSGVQIKMLAEISKVYGIPFQKNRGKALVGALIGFVLPRTFSVGLLGSLLKTIPGIGQLIGAPSMALFCGASAWALGKVFIQHFESGGTFLDFNPEAVREYFRAQYEEGRNRLATMKTEEKAEA